MNTHISFFASLVICLAVTAAWSQDVPPPPPAPALSPVPSDASPGAAVPSTPSQPVPYNAPPGTYSAPPAYSPPPGAVMVAPGQPYPPYAYAAPGPYAGPVVLVPAPPLPSTPWMARIEALFLERSTGSSIPLGYTYFNSGSQPLADNLYSDDVSFPLAAGLRLEISHKLDDNLTLGATYWGLQQWSVDDTIYGDPVGQSILAYSPYLQLPVFDNALGYTYSSQIQNVEINALIRLNPADPYWEVNWLWGARYVYMAENLTLTGVDSFSSTTESLSSKTANNLVGVQTGLLFVHGWSRFQWEAGLKVGLAANIYHQHNIDTASDPAGIPNGFVPYDVTNNGCGLSAMFELSFASCYRITDNLGLRLAYQVYDFTGLALAPRNLGSPGHGGNVALDGLSIGLQASW